MDKAMSSEKLLGMMVVSEKISHSFTMISKMLSDPKVINRSYAIEWIKKILSKEVRGSVETGIQIFDRFVLSTYAEDNTILADTMFLSYSAACCAIMGVKLLDAKSPLNMASFSSFNTEKLMEFERRILTVTFGKIYPLCCPASFVQLLIAHCPPAQSAAQLVLTASMLISEFEESRDFLLYAPSTVAISALLIAFSLQHVHCGAWVESLPDYCLPNNAQGVFSRGPLFLDIDGCILAFEKIPMLRSHHHQAKSPTGIADAF